MRIFEFFYALHTKWAWVADIEYKLSLKIPTRFQKNEDIH